MKFGLNVGERMITLTILPQEGNIITLKMIRDLKSKIGLSAQELKEFEVAQDGERVKWNQKGLVPRDFDFAEAEIDLIKKQLKKLDSDGKLHQDMLPVYEKFVEAK